MHRSKEFSKKCESFPFVEVINDNMAASSISWFWGRGMNDYILQKDVYAVLIIWEVSIYSLFFTQLAGVFEPIDQGDRFRFRDTLF